MARAPKVSISTPPAAVPLPVRGDATPDPTAMPMDGGAAPEAIQGSPSLFSDLDLDPCRVIRPDKTPHGFLLSVLKGDLLRDASANEAIRKALNAGRIGDFPGAEDNWPEYGPALELVRRHPAATPEMVAMVEAIQEAWYVEGEAQSRGVLFPKARVLEDLFASIEPYEGVAREREKQRARPEVVAWLRVENLERHESRSVELRPSVVAAIRDHMRSIVDDPNIYFEVYAGDKVSSVYAQYNQILGNRLLARVDTASLRATLGLPPLGEVTSPWNVLNCGIEGEGTRDIWDVLGNKIASLGEGGNGIHLAANAKLMALSPTMREDLEAALAYCDPNRVKQQWSGNEVEALKSRLEATLAKARSTKADMTPGPWTFGPGPVTTPTGELYILDPSGNGLACLSPRGNGSRIESHAREMAAAPVRYEALKAALNFVDPHLMSQRAWGQEGLQALKAQIEAAIRGDAPAATPVASKTPAASKAPAPTPSASRTTLAPDVLDVLNRSVIEDNLLKLPEQLDRKLYLKVNEALELLGGKWNRKLGGHVFQDDPGTLIEAALETGSVRDDQKHYQFFQTPRAVAERMIDLAEVRPGQTILEPSAGAGAILEPLLNRLPRAERRAEKLAEGTRVHACELNPEQWATLEAMPIHLSKEDFLAYQPGPIFDRVIANPPFTRSQDIQHADHMLDCLKPGGRLVTVLSAGFKFREDKRTTAFKARLASECEGVEVMDLGHGAFRESGTMVNTVLLVANRRL